MLIYIVIVSHRQWSRAIAIEKCDGWSQVVGLPSFHLTYGIGEPTATQVNVRLAPNITSFNGSGGTENCGGTRRTFTYNAVGFECSVPTEFSATHSYFPWSSVMLLSICRLPAIQKRKKNMYCYCFVHIIIISKLENRKSFFSIRKTHPMNIYCVA